MFGWFRNKKLEKRIAELEKHIAHEERKPYSVISIGRGGYGGSATAKTRKPYTKKTPSVRDYILAHMSDGKVRNMHKIRKEINKEHNIKRSLKSYQGRLSELVKSGKMVRVGRALYQIKG